jgi:tripartite-type tricarboxylate transporter receptor subunit TctC
MRTWSRPLFALCLAIPVLWATASAAQNWPTRPVKFILTLGAGSGSDIGARLLADRLTKRWGQPIVIENRPGGDGLVAINAFVSAHDNHILLFAPSSSFTGHPYLHANLSYKPSDLSPITRVSNTIITVSVPTAMNIPTLGDMVKKVRAEPGKLNWAGVTGALDLLFAGWLKSEGLDIKKVPYRNPVEAANDLAEGRVQVYEAALAIVRPQVEAGKIKILAVTNTVRGPAHPNIPTVAEAGFPALTLDGLVGLFGQPEFPAALRERITADIREVAANDAIVIDRMKVTGQVLNIGGAAEFAKSIDEQRAKIAESAAALGIKPMQ